MSGLREVAGAEKPGATAANFAKLDKTMQAGLCTKIRAMGEMGAHVGKGTGDLRTGQARDVEQE